MSIVSYLDNKQKVMRNLIDILIDFYGQPQWLIKPKKGQSSEEIMKQWIATYGDYCAEDLSKAAYSLFKWHKLKTFPTMSHVNMALGSSEKEQQKAALKQYHHTCKEVELWRADMKLGKRFFTMPHYRRSVNYILDFMLLEQIGQYDYYAIEESCKDKKTQEIDMPLLRGKKCRRAEELGLFEMYMDSLLLKSYQGEL
ncbi:MAG: hypothetical protein R3Y43_04145 [Alphaproteobacteria bacterium]